MIASQPQTPSALEQMRALCSDIHVEHPTGTVSQGCTAPLAESHCGDVIERVHGLAQPLPYTHHLMDRLALHQLVRDVLARYGPDLLVVDSNMLAFELLGPVGEWGGPSMARFQNVDSLFERRKLVLDLRRARRPRPSLSGWRSVHRLQAAERRVMGTYTWYRQFQGWTRRNCGV